MCVCVCVLGGSPSLIPTSSPIKGRETQSLTGSMDKRQDPTLAAETPITNLHLVFPSPLHSQAFSILSSELGQVITHLGVYSTKVFRLPGLHPAWTRSCNIPAVTISLVSSESMPAAAAAKSLQSCPTMCDPIYSSPPGSSVPGILQARILEWVAISFSRACLGLEQIVLFCWFFFFFNVFFKCFLYIKNNTGSPFFLLKYPF